MPTLAEHQHRPMLLKRDLSQIPCSVTAKRVKDFMDKDKDSSRSPEHDAITFYLMNHAWSLVGGSCEPDEKLGNVEQVVDRYFDVNAEPIVRMFYYLLLICTRESRHVKNTSTHAIVQAKYGSGCAEFNSLVRGCGGGSQAVQKFFATPPNATLGNFTASLEYIFNNGSFSSGYGGKAWGKVAHCLNEFVWGRYTAEMMMDTAWTLCHNNGPIFNKGMLYSMYSSDLVRYLDVQRSGQIPQLINDHINGVKYLSNYITETHVALHKMVRQFFPAPDQFGGYIDWEKVKKLGALHSYSSFYDQQVNKYGPSPLLNQPKPQAHEWVSATDPATVADVAEYFLVTPKLKLKKLKRSEVKEKIALYSK